MFYLGNVFAESSATTKDRTLANVEDSGDEDEYEEDSDEDSEEERKKKEVVVKYKEIFKFED